MENFDCIVLGTGGVGSAALYHLAKRGSRVLGIDRFPAAHDRGSSHGETRIIRRAYFEHPDYVPLLLRAYELWAELETRAGRRLYHETGLLQASPAKGRVVPGVLESARRHGLPVERLSAGEAERRFPGFRLPDSEEGGALEAVFEARAGFLLVEECVRAHLAAAASLGAEIRSEETILSWRAEGSGFRVRTDRGEYGAARIVMAAGSWAQDLLAELLSDLGVRLEVRRKPVFWYATANDALAEERGAPAFLFELSRGVFYGFPRFRGALKVAEHTGGERVADPLQVDRSIRQSDREPVEAFLRAHLPGVAGEPLRHSVCLYTLTPDQHFIVDRHPAHPRLAFACGLSGHGFKFTAALGEALSQLVLDGGTKLPIGFLSLARPGLRI